MKNGYTPVIAKRERFWIGWIEEVPGVNSQGETREELMANLESALSEMLELQEQDGEPAHHE